MDRVDPAPTAALCRDGKNEEVLRRKLLGSTKQQTTWLVLKSCPFLQEVSVDSSSFGRNGADEGQRNLGVLQTCNCKDRVSAAPLRGQVGASTGPKEKK